MIFWVKAVENIVLLQCLSQHFLYTRKKTFLTLHSVRKTSLRYITWGKSFWLLEWPLIVHLSSLP